MEKACRKCGQVKSLDDFHKSNSSPDGRQYRCKLCAISAARQRALDNPDAKRLADQKYSKSEKCKAKRKDRREGEQRETILQQKRDSYYRHHETQLELMRLRSSDPEFKAKDRERKVRYAAKNPRMQLQASLKSAYAMTLDEYDALVLRQAGRCDICEDPLDKPNVDHCHGSGRIRALLCGHCNRGLGYFRDNPEALRKAAEYLEAHAA